MGIRGRYWVYFDLLYKLREDEFYYGSVDY